MMSMTKILFVAFFFWQSIWDSLAFSPGFVRVKSPTRSTKGLQHSSTSLSLAKKRRRKKGDNAPTPESDDLPDFDLNEDDEPVKAKSSSAGMASEPLGEISSAMMGSSNAPTRSVDQLIKDRSLEKNFQFDEPDTEEALPDLAVLAKENEVGRKKARREARVAAAIARKDDEEEQVNPLTKIEFITDEKGEVSGVKILEAGAWLGIFALVGWELYINSPLFDRAAPPAPFIYDFIP